MDEWWSGVTGAATAVGADNSFGGYRTEDTLPSDAAQSMVGASDSGAGGSWAGWLQGLGSTVANTALARYAQRHAQPVGPQYPAGYVGGQPMQQVPQASGGINTKTVLVLGGVGLGVVVILAVLLRKG